MGHEISFHLGKFFISKNTLLMKLCCSFEVFVNIVWLGLLSRAGNGIVIIWGSISGKKFTRGDVHNIDNPKDTKTTSCQ